MPASLAGCSSKRDMAATLLKYCYHGSHCQSIPLFIGSPSAVSRPSSVVRCPLSVVPLHIRQVSRAGSKSSAATNAIRFVLHRVVGNRNSLKFPRPLPGNAARPMHNALRQNVSLSERSKMHFIGLSECLYACCRLEKGTRAVWWHHLH